MQDGKYMPLYPQIYDASLSECSAFVLEKQKWRVDKNQDGKYKHLVVEFCQDKDNYMQMQIKFKNIKKVYISDCNQRILIETVVPCPFFR